MWDWDRKVPAPFYICLLCLHTHVHMTPCATTMQLRRSEFSPVTVWVLGIELSPFGLQQVSLPNESSRHPNPIFLILYFHRGQFWGLNPGSAFARQVLYHWCNPQLSTFLLSLTFVLPALCLNAPFYVTLPVFIPHDCISQKLWNSMYCSSSVSCPWPSPLHPRVSSFYILAQ